MVTGGFRLDILLPTAQLARATYYYQVKQLETDDKDKALKDEIQAIYDEHKGNYGYRRIHLELRNRGFCVNHKKVQRLMKELGLAARIRRKRKYSSYKGEVGKKADNLINRQFEGAKPYEKCYTDVTEFALTEGKVYLSPILDCFDGMVPAWSIGTSPNAELVNSSLEKAIETLTEGESPFIHSDRGVHYFWKGWLELIEDNNLTRSMSKKGCSPDNSACEGFFGHLKSECFYGKEFKDYSIKQFIEYLNNCINWHNTKRIKKTLGYQSPVEYRLALGYAA